MAEGGDAAEQQRSNRIQVSSTKKPMFFYVNLAKRMLAEHGEIELSALGLAISTMVSVAEILKKDGLVVQTSIQTCMESLGGDDSRRPIQKAKMQIGVKKSDEFDEIIARMEKERAARGAANGDEEGGEEGDEGEEEEEE